MDYTDLTYKMQVMYIKKIYEMRINHIDYQNKMNEFRKLINVYEGVFDYEDVRNVTYDIPVLEGKFEEDKK